MTDMPETYKGALEAVAAAAQARDEYRSHLMYNPTTIADADIPAICAAILAWFAADDEHHSAAFFAADAVYDRAAYGQ